MSKKGVSIYGCRNQLHIHDDISILKKNNIDYVVLGLSEFDIWFYPGYIKNFLKEARKANIETFLDFWGHGNAFGGEPPSFFVMQNPNACQISNKGKRIPKACFNNPLFYTFMKNQFDKVYKEFSFDGIFLDEPNFFITRNQKQWGCYCSICEKKFRKKLPKKLDNVMKNYRFKSTKSFLEKFSKHIKSKNKKIKISLCTLPPVSDTSVKIKNYAKIKNIDILGTDPYWFNKNLPVKFVNDTAKELKHYAGKEGKKTEIWIQCYNVPSGREKEIRTAVDYCKKNKIDYICSWTYLSGLGSILESGNPQKSWETLIKSYKK